MNAVQTNLLSIRIHKIFTCIKKKQTKCIQNLDSNTIKSVTAIFTMMHRTVLDHAIELPIKNWTCASSN